MPVPAGIVTRLRDLGVKSSYVTGEDTLSVRIDPNIKNVDVVWILAAIYQADPTQSCRWVSQDEQGFHKFVFSPLMNIVDDAEEQEE